MHRLECGNLFLFFYEPEDTRTSANRVRSTLVTRQSGLCGLAPWRLGVKYSSSLIWVQTAGARSRE